MANTTSQASQLKACLETVQRIYDEDQNKLIQQIAILEKKNKELLDNKLVNENLNLTTVAKLREENEMLQGQICILEGKLNASNLKIVHLENTVKSNRNKIAKKLSSWEEYGKLINLHCTCDVNNKLKCNKHLESNSSFQDGTSKCKQSNASKVFFSSPLKTTNLDASAWAPMTEQIDDSINFTNTPVVGETERVFDLGYTNENEAVVLSDDEKSSFLFSPSLVSTMKESKGANGVSHSYEFKKPMPINCSNLETPVKVIETSAELFTDVSPAIEQTMNKKSKFNNSNAAQPKRNKNKVCTEKNGKTRKKKINEPYHINEDSFFNENVKQLKNVPEIITSSTCFQDNKTVITTPGNVSIKLKHGFGDIDLKRNNEPEVNYKYNEVVRKKKDRDELDGFDCHECRRYYASDNLTEKQLKEILKNCSKHRHKSAPPPDTPDEFWSIGFPDTQEYLEKGYMLDENQSLPDHVKPKWQQKEKSRKRIKYQ